jgi:hypothetical protein
VRPKYCLNYISECRSLSITFSLIRKQTEVPIKMLSPYVCSQNNTEQNEQNSNIFKDGCLLGCSDIALMMEAARTSETLVNCYQTTRATNQKTAIFVLTAVRTSNPTNIFSLQNYSFEKRSFLYQKYLTLYFYRSCCPLTNVHTFTTLMLSITAVNNYGDIELSFVITVVIFIAFYYWVYSVLINGWMRTGWLYFDSQKEH